MKLYMFVVAIVYSFQLAHAMQQEKPHQPNEQELKEIQKIVDKTKITVAQIKPNENIGDQISSIVQVALQNQKLQEDSENKISKIIVISIEKENHITVDEVIPKITNTVSTEKQIEIKELSPSFFKKIHTKFMDAYVDRINWQPISFVVVILILTGISLWTLAMVGIIAHTYAGIPMVHKHLDGITSNSTFNETCLMELMKNNMTTFCQQQYDNDMTLYFLVGFLGFPAMISLGGILSLIGITIHKINEYMKRGATDTL
ncbi:MAG: hypothetical protein M0Q46_06545 [Endomicrobiales bacterium]|nr:hypothetical protein [Endomicrobiales bacterium]